MPKQRKPPTATIHVSRDLHHQLKMAAAADGVSIQSWLAAALAAELARRPARPRISRPHAISPELRDLLSRTGGGR